MQQAAWSFVAMEYYAAILNRTFAVAIAEESLDGVLCRGLTSTAGGGDVLTRIVTGKLAVHGDLDDPASYLDDRLLKMDSRANFSIEFRDICSVEYNPRKKWGMAYYPHDGRVLVGTATRTREFIILGGQSGQDICARLSAAVGRANNSFKPNPLRRSA